MHKEARSFSTHDGDSVIPVSHVLLVDDDPVLVEALSDTLHIRLGHFTLDICDTGMKALDRVRAKTYDTIISDVDMPNVNGLHVLTAVKRTRPDTPVLLMSGHADRALMAQALEAGASDFLAKPFDRDVFVSAVRRALELSRLRSVVEMQHKTLNRTKNHYTALIAKLSEYNEAYVDAAQESQNSGLYGLVSPIDDAQRRRENAERHVQMFLMKARRHLHGLDAFLLRFTQVHRETVERLSTAQENMRRHALMKL